MRRPAKELQLVQIVVSRFHFGVTAQLSFGSNDFKNLLNSWLSPKHKIIGVSDALPPRECVCLPCQFVTSQWFRGSGRNVASVLKAVKTFLCNHLSP